MSRAWRAAVRRFWTGGQRGATAIFMLIAVMVTAVPIVASMAGFSSRLSRSERVYDRLLDESYAANSGVEHAFWKVKTDPDFTRTLTSASPTGQVSLAVNGASVATDVTRIQSEDPLQGQGLVVLTKAVQPTTASAGVATTFAYSITVRNEGSSTMSLTKVTDFLPPGFTHVNGSTTGDLTTAEPTITPPPPASSVDKSTWYLNHVSSQPKPLSLVRGASSQERALTPAQSVWAQAIDYWETPALAEGVMPSATWNQTLRLKTNHATNQWRVRVMRNRGGNLTLVHQSAAAGASTSWSSAVLAFSPGQVAAQAGDKLRVYLEFFSDRSSSSQRTFNYRWGGNSSYISSLRMPDVAATASACSGLGDRLDWSLSPAVGVAGNEQRTLTFQASASLSAGVYYNQSSITYQPWWTGTPIEVFSPYTAPITVGGGTQNCGSGLAIRLDKAVSSWTPIDGSDETEVTYAITAFNAWAATLPLQAIDDVLPPGFHYVLGTTSVQNSTMGPYASDPAVSTDPTSGRQLLHWGTPPETQPPFGIAAGETLTLQFRARGVVAVGARYYNELQATYVPADPPPGALAYADIVLALDHSNSIDSSEFVQLQQAAHTIVDALNLPASAGRIRVGMTCFRGESLPMASMTTDATVLHAAIDAGRCTFQQTGTNIVAGLQGAAAQFATGLGDRPGVPNVMIFVTDGNDTWGNTLAQIAAASLATGAEVFAVGVGVGAEIDNATLNAIATDPDADHVVPTADFEELAELAEDIAGGALQGAKFIAATQGGASPAAVMYLGTYYDVKATAGVTEVQTRVLVRWDNALSVLSWQKN